VSTKALGLGAVLFLAIGLSPVLASRFLEGDLSTAAPVVSALGDIAGWDRASAPTTTWRPRYLQPSAERFESFSSGNRNVGVYIGYYRNQSGASKLVSSENVLVASADPRWLQIAAGQREARAHGVPGIVQTADLSSRADERLRVWHWYWVDGRWTDSPIRAKVWTAFAQLAGRGDDSAVVMLVTAKGAGAEATAQADAVLDAFADAAVATIASTLQATRGPR
jgi:EpsI family protein